VIAEQLISIYAGSQPANNNPKLAYKYKLKGMLGINFSFPLVDTVIVGEQIKKCNNNELDGILKGFADFEPHPNYGRIAWIKSHAHVILMREKYINPVISIVCPYPEWNWFNIDVAYKNITVFVDGIPKTVQLIKDESKKYCVFLIDVSDAKQESKHIDIEIEFKEPTVALQLDSRGLCLLYCDLTVINKTELDSIDEVVKKIAYIEAKLLKTRQTWQLNQYLQNDKNTCEEINKKILMATDLLLAEDT
jgi:hypothetical protein